MHWTALNELQAFGVKVVSNRVGRDGKFITAAGVSTGIDMVLKLAVLKSGDDRAQAIHLGLEYDPHLTFDAVTPEKVTTSAIELV
jgi:transcriptional regulator GlxA family with amidase domain